MLERFFSQKEIEWIKGQSGLSVVEFDEIWKHLEDRFEGAAVQDLRLLKTGFASLEESI